MRTPSNWEASKGKSLPEIKPLEELSREAGDNPRKGAGVNLKGQSLSFIAKIKNYPIEIETDPLAYQSYADFLLFAAHHSPIIQAYINATGKEMKSDLITVIEFFEFVTENYWGIDNETNQTKELYEAN